MQQWSLRYFSHVSSLVPNVALLHQQKMRQFLNTQISHIHKWKFSKHTFGCNGTSQEEHKYHIWEWQTLQRRRRSVGLFFTTWLVSREAGKRESWTFFESSESTNERRKLNNGPVLEEFWRFRYQALTVQRSRIHVKMDQYHLRIRICVLYVLIFWSRVSTPPMNLL